MSSNTVGIILMLQLLNKRAVSRTQIIEHTGLGRTTVQRYIRLLHAKRLIRIAEWHIPGRARLYSPHFEWNQDNFPDVPPPPTKTRSDIYKDYRRHQLTKSVTGVQF